MVTEMAILCSVCAISSPLPGNPPHTCVLLERSLNRGLTFSLKNQSCCRQQKALKINFQECTKNSNQLVSEVLPCARPLFCIFYQFCCVNPSVYNTSRLVMKCLVPSCFGLAAASMAMAEDAGGLRRWAAMPPVCNVVLKQ